jgi:hypothetical protein
MGKTYFKKPNKKGRNDFGKPFVKLDHELLKTPAYRALAPSSRALLIELAMLFNGSNNGSLYLSQRDGAALMGVSDTTAAKRAFDELQDLGFIVLTRDAHFNVKAADASRARCWRLTWQHTNTKGPTCEYQTRQPEPATSERRRMERGLKTLKARARKQSARKFPHVDCRTMQPNDGS